MNELQTKDEQELENKMYLEIKDLIESSKRKAYITVNSILLDLYWRIGENIVNNLQKREEKAKYGEHVLRNLSIRLTSTYGKSFSKSNLEYMRRFYLSFPIAQTLSGQLGWSHYVEFLKVNKENIRSFYMQECINSRWDVRTLRRMINSHLYERLLISDDEDNKLAVQGNIINSSKDLIKDPYVLDLEKEMVKLRY